MNDDIFSAFESLMNDAFGQVDSVLKQVDKEIDNLKKKVASGEVKVRNFIIKDGKLVELPMVPTTDKISFTKNPVRKNEIKSKKNGKKPNDDTGISEFTKTEVKKIREMRKAGSSIKDIARNLHRSDKTVSRFVKTNGI